MHRGGYTHREASAAMRSAASASWYLQNMLCSQVISGSRCTTRKAHSLRADRCSSPGGFVGAFMFGPSESDSGADVVGPKVIRLFRFDGA